MKKNLLHYWGNSAGTIRVAVRSFGVDLSLDCNEK